MKNILMRRWAISVTCFMLLFLVSCQSELDKYYELPGWLKGNAWEVLEAKGNYTLFLQGVEKVGYKTLVNGKGEMTVMAPTDSAFQVYMKDKGYSSMDEWYSKDPQGLSNLITYHLIYYSFDKDRFMNYKPNGAESDKNNLEAGLYFKFRTKSRDLTETVVDPITGKTIKVLHKEKFLPVLSENIFKTKLIDAKTNYEYFYPQTKWNGTGGFMVSNAPVGEYAVITDNGYVYSLNKVLEPLSTVYNTMQSNSDYSLFSNIYDKFVSYQYDAQGTANYGKGDSLYLHYFTSLPQLASEWSVNGTGDYEQLAPLAKNGFNAFAPSNASLTDFFNNFFKPYGYESITDVNLLPLMILSASHVSTGSLVFPDEIKGGKVLANDGSVVNFDVTSVNTASICSNGCFYGLKGMITSPYFTSVSGAVLQNPNYSIFSKMLASTGFLTSLISQSLNFTLFIPSNATLLNYTHPEGREIRYVNGTPKIYGTDEIEVTGDDVDWMTMKNAMMKGLSGSCIGTKLITSIGDSKIYRTINSFDYVYVNGSKIYSTHAYNTGASSDGVPSLEKISGDWTNGNTYKQSGDVSSMISEPRTFKTILTTNPADAELPSSYVRFRSLFNLSGLNTTIPAMSFMQGERFIALIPNETAINAGINSKEIPTSPASAVASYVKGYFISVPQSGLTDYLFPGQNTQGTLVTYKIKSDGSYEPCNLTYKSTAAGITISGKTKTVNVTDFFPHIYEDGAAYMIDGLLDVE